MLDVVVKLWSPATPIGEHGQSLENIENMDDKEKMKNIKQMTKNMQFTIQNVLFINQMTQNTLSKGLV